MCKVTLGNQPNTIYFNVQLVYLEWLPKKVTFQRHFTKRWRGLYSEIKIIQFGEGQRAYVDIGSCEKASELT